MPLRDHPQHDLATLADDAHRLEGLLQVMALLLHLHPDHGVFDSSIRWPISQIGALSSLQFNVLFAARRQARVRGRLEPFGASKTIMWIYGRITMGDPRLLEGRAGASATSAGAHMPPGPRAAWPTGPGDIPLYRDLAHWHCWNPRTGADTI